MRTARVPVEKPHQLFMRTLGVVLYSILCLILPCFSLGCFLYSILCGKLVWRLLAIAYFINVYYDRANGYAVMDGNGWKLMRNNFIWRGLRNYFPIELVKTAELLPNRNYVLAGFPHGILTFGASTNMALDIGQWLKLFPGIRPKDTILEICFCIPIFREILRWSGWIPVTAHSLLNQLSKSNDPNHPDNEDGYTSNAVIILVGGAEEALNSYPGHYCITLRKRKGFVRMAIKSGAAIVPTFSFGEVDAFDQWDQSADSFFGRLQLWIKRVTTISPVLFKGRYFFLPYRRPIVQVVGAPIEVQQCDNPEQKYVDEVHQQVITAVTELFNTYKFKYIDNCTNVELIIK